MSGLNYHYTEERLSGVERHATFVEGKRALASHRGKQGKFAVVLVLIRGMNTAGAMSPNISWTTPSRCLGSHHSDNPAHDTSTAPSRAHTVACRCVLSTRPLVACSSGFCGRAKSATLERVRVP